VCVWGVLSLAPNIRQLDLYSQESYSPVAGGAGSEVAEVDRLGELKSLDYSNMSTYNSLPSHLKSRDSEGSQMREGSADLLQVLVSELAHWRVGFARQCFYSVGKNGGTIHIQYPLVLTDGSVSWPSLWNSGPTAALEALLAHAFYEEPEYQSVYMDRGLSHYMTATHGLSSESGSHCNRSVFPGMGMGSPQ
jgi:hypothetical protein